MSPFYYSGSQKTPERKYDVSVGRLTYAICTSDDNIMSSVDNIIKKNYPYDIENVQ